MNATVTEIHRYPMRPPGFVEPLFPTEESRRKVAEHLLRSPWLSRASELRGRGGETAHTLNEPVEVNSLGGRVEVLRNRAGRRCSWKRRRIFEVLDRWREVGEWWDERRGTDRAVYRVLLSGGVVADLSRDRSGEWLLVGVVD